MFLPVQVIADWENVRNQKKQKIYLNNKRENNKQQVFDWQPGMEVLVEDKDNRYKLNPKATGPFIITKVHTNGTVTIKKSAHDFQQINIRRMKPYYRCNA